MKTGIPIKRNKENQLEIYIIRHARVNLDWPKHCDVSTFHAYRRQYDQAPIDDVPPLGHTALPNKIYISSLPRSLATAKGLFGHRDFTVMPEIGEVPIYAKTRYRVRFPTWIWHAFGHFQWLINDKCQVETRAQTEARADAVIDRLERQNEDCVLVSHGLFMLVLMRRLKKRGYDVSANHRVTFKNLDMVRISKAPIAESR